MHLIDDGIISLSLHSDHAVVVSISYKYVVRKGCNIEGVVPAFIFIGGRQKLNSCTYS